MYLRFLTSAQIRLAQAEFEPYLFHPEIGIPMEARDFCETFVEATGKEAGAYEYPFNLQRTAHCMQITSCLSR